LRRPPLEVRGAEQKKRNWPDNQFEKQLRKEGNGKKNEERKSNDDQALSSNTAPLNTGAEIHKADHQTESEGHKIIDILV